MHVILTLSQLVGLFCIGYIDQAIELGFQVYETRNGYPK
jgi:hypothetical protein